MLQIHKLHILFNCQECNITYNCERNVVKIPIPQGKTSRKTNSTDNN